jgi:hypothetical protein
MDQWQPDAELEQSLFSFYFTLFEMYGCPSFGTGKAGRGRPRADPTRDVFIYTMASTMRKYKRPKHPGLEPHRVSWKVIYQVMNDGFKAKDEREIDTLIRCGEGTVLKVTHSGADFMYEMGYKFAPLSFGGFRSAYKRGKKIFEKVKRKQKMERPDRVLTPCFAPVKYDAKHEAANVTLIPYKDGTVQKVTHSDKDFTDKILNMERSGRITRLSSSTPLKDHTMGRTIVEGFYRIPALSKKTFV